jgi:hypothetical protein
MKKFLFLIFISIGFKSVIAQNSPVLFKISEIDKPIVFQMNQVSADIEGYDGDQISIVTIAQKNERIKTDTNGLKQIAVPGQEIKAGNINPTMTEDNHSIRIVIPPGDYKHLVIKVPKKGIIVVKMATFFNDGKLTVKNINSISIIAIVPSIEVSNVSDFRFSTGGDSPNRRFSDKIILSDINWTDEPIIINGVSQPREHMIGSNSASIELNLSDSIKSNIVFLSRNGQIFSNLGVNSNAPSLQDKASFENNFGKNENVKSISLNGGGKRINIFTIYGDIYLKKSK